MDDIQITEEMVETTVAASFNAEWGANAWANPATTDFEREEARAQARAALRAVAPSIAAAALAKLQEPGAVHINMLHGRIPKLTWAQCVHLWLAEAEAERATARASALEEAARLMAAKAEQHRQMSHSPQSRNIVSECYEDAAASVRSLKGETT